MATGSLAISEQDEATSYSFEDIHWTSSKECLIAQLGNHLIFSPLIGIVVPEDDEWLWEVRRFTGCVTHFGVCHKKEQAQDVVERYLMEEC